MCQNKLKPKWIMSLAHEITFSINFNTESVMLSKRFETTIFEIEPVYVSGNKKMRKTVSPKALKMRTGNINLRYKIIFTSFDQNSAEFYDNEFFNHDLYIVARIWG